MILQQPIPFESVVIESIDENPVCLVAILLLKREIQLKNNC